MLAVAAAAATCVDEEEVAPGAPVLESMAVVDAMGMPVSLEADGGIVLVSPRSSFLALFDRLLDPAEVSFSAETQSQQKVATLEAPGMPTATVDYTPNGSTKDHLLLPPGPALHIVPTPTLPSGSLVKVTLNLGQILAKDKKTPAVAGAGAVATLTLQTAPFAATIALPDPADGGEVVIPQDFTPTVTFNNVPDPQIATHIRVAAISPAGDAYPLEANVAASPMDGSVFTITPKTGTWPAGVRLTVEVDAGAADVLGVKVPAPVTASGNVAP